jgi:hypothetical protein
MKRYELKRDQDSNKKWTVKRKTKKTEVFWSEISLNKKQQQWSTLIRDFSEIHVNIRSADFFLGGSDSTPNRQAYN